MNGGSSCKNKRTSTVPEAYAIPYNGIVLKKCTVHITFVNSIRRLHPNLNICKRFLVFRGQKRFVFLHIKPFIPSVPSLWDGTIYVRNFSIPNLFIPTLPNAPQQHKKLVQRFTFEHITNPKQHKDKAVMQEETFKKLPISRFSPDMNNMDAPKKQVLKGIFYLQVANWAWNWAISTTARQVGSTG